MARLSKIDREEKKMNDKKTILAVVGKSGSGKTTFADYICDKYFYKLVQSYTERKPRYEGEGGHTFVSPQEMDSLYKKDLLAETTFGGNRYCCLESDLVQNNVYVIDEHGLAMITSRFNKKYHLTSVYIDRDEATRVAEIGAERVARDAGKYSEDYTKFDYIISNDGSIDELFSKADRIVGDLR
jgi:guanylate kinase